MKILQTGILILLSIFLIPAQAGNDPVTWSLSPPTGFRSVNIGESTSVTYTLTAHAKLPGPLTLLTSFKEKGETFSIIDHCNHQTLHPGASCKVIITYTARNSGRASIQMSYSYHRTVINLPTLKVPGTDAHSPVVGTMSGIPAQFSLSNPQQQPIFKITYTNTGPDHVTGYAGNASGNLLLSTNPSNVATVRMITGKNFCGTNRSPVTLNPGEKCSISGQLIPKAVGEVTVSGLFTYNNQTKTANPLAHTKVIKGSGHCQLNAEATLPLQNPTYKYADNVLQFTFTNHCTSKSVTLGNVRYSASGSSTSPSITPSARSAGAQLDKCSGATLRPNQSCSVLVSVIPQTAGSLTIIAAVTADSLSASAQTSTQVQTPGYTHKITFVNQCPFPVWYGVSQPTGSKDPTPNPSPSVYLLPAQAEGTIPAIKAITLPGAYNGQFFPRTACAIQGSSFVCQTGDCASGTNAQCPANNGNVYSPYTRVEATFTSSSQGQYDISLINGASIPAEIKGLGPLSSQFASPAAPYVCIGAGAPIPPAYKQFNPQFPPPPPPLPPLPAPATPLGSCSWTYTPPSVSSIYNFVTRETTVKDCKSCSSTTVCGLAFQTTPAAGNIVLACGQLIGYWTINQLCSGNVTYVGANQAFNPSRVFNCKSAITQFSSQVYAPGTNVYDLYACVPQGNNLQSCYNSGTNTTCCGAKDWNAVTPYLTWQTQQAFTTNPDWVNGSTGGKQPLSPTPLESIEWLKRACPTAYSYPFDDHSSTFTCNTSDAAQQNPVKMDFEVVFCPGGIVGDLSLKP